MIFNGICTKCKSDNLFNPEIGKAYYTSPLQYRVQCQDCGVKDWSLRDYGRGIFIEKKE